jgi:hypothetical protein
MPDTPPNRSLFAAGIKKAGITASTRPGRQRGRPAGRSGCTARRQRAIQAQAARTITAADPCPTDLRQAPDCIHATYEFLPLRLRMGM